MHATVAAGTEYDHVSDYRGNVSQAVQAILTESQHAEYEFVQQNGASHTREGGRGESGINRVPGRRRTQAGVSAIRNRQQPHQPTPQGPRRFHEGGRHIDAAAVREKTDQLNTFYAAAEDGIIPNCPDWVDNERLSRPWMGSGATRKDALKRWSQPTVVTRQHRPPRKWLAGLTPGTGNGPQGPFQSRHDQGPRSKTEKTTSPGMDGSQQEGPAAGMQRGLPPSHGTDVGSKTTHAPEFRNQTTAPAVRRSLFSPMAGSRHRGCNKVQGTRETKTGQESDLTTSHSRETHDPEGKGPHRRPLQRSGPHGRSCNVRTGRSTHRGHQHPAALAYAGTIIGTAAAAGLTAIAVREIRRCLHGR